MTIRLFSSAAAVVAALGIAGSGAAQERDLTGRWTLKDQSDTLELGDRDDDPGSVGDPTLGPRSGGGVRPGFGGRGGRGGGGPWGRTGRPPLSDEERARVRQLLRAARPVRTFELVQNGSAIVYTAGRAEPITIFPDGPKVQVVMADGAEVEVKAKWDDGELVVERRIDGVGEIQRRYAIADSGLFMRVETRVEGDALPRSVERVRMYRKVPVEDL